jgi:hypothetical protein
MMASIPNMRSTPLTLPAAKAPATGEAAPGDFAAQLPAVPGPPIEAEILPLDPGLDPIVPSMPSPEELKAGATGSDGETVADAPEAKAGERKDDQPEPVVVIPFLQDQPPVAVVQPPTIVPAAVAPGAPAPAEAAPTPVGKYKGKSGTPDGGKTGLPVPDGAKAAADAVESREIEAAVKELLARKPVLSKQVAAAPKAPPGDGAKPELAPDLALPHGRTRVQARGQAPATIQTAAPLPAAELPQPAAIVGQVQPEPVTAEKTGTVEGARTAGLAAERKLDLARDSQWLDRLARDIAQAGASDTPLRFRLHPQTLGSLHVELQQGDHGTAVRLTVETEAARQILTDAQPRLAAEARAQGVRIAESHVDLSGSGRHAPGDQRRQDEARQTPFIRTARGADANGPARASSRARLDRYA